MLKLEDDSWGLFVGEISALTSFLEEIYNHASFSNIPSVNLHILDDELEFSIPNSGISFSLRKTSDG